MGQHDEEYLAFHVLKPYTTLPSAGQHIHYTVVAGFQKLFDWRMIIQYDDNIQSMLTIQNPLMFLDYKI